MMKKTLVALAATAVTGAFAQVAITGNIDIGLANSSGQTTANNTTAIAGSNTSTQTLAFSGTEDLGGGLKAGFKLETTIAANSASSLNGSAQTAPYADGHVWSGTPFSSEQFVSLAGGFGTVRAGVPNAAVFRAQGVSQPFGTGLSSGYSGTYSRLGYAGGYGLSGFAGVANGGGTSLRVIRMNNTVQYETPNMNGLSAMVEMSFGNDNQTSTSAFAANSGSFQGLLVNYDAGALKVAGAVNTYKVGINTVAGNSVLSTTTLSSGALAANQSVDYQFLGGNYTVGKSTYYVGLSSVKASDATEDSQSWNVAYKFAFNENVDLLANMVSTTSQLPLFSNTTIGMSSTTKNLNKKLIGFGADYRLSKRTSLYARYENTDTNTDNSSTGETIKTAFGVRHQF